MTVLEDLLLKLTPVGWHEGTAQVEETAGAIKHTDTAAKDATKSHVALGKSFGGLKSMASSLAGTAGIAGVGLALGDAVKQAQALQDAQAQLGASIHANVRRPAKDATAQVSDFADSLSTKGGFAPTESIKGMTQLVRVTHDVGKAQADMTLSTNVARGAHVDLGRAVRAVTMLEEGHTTGLSRLGIAITPVTTAVDTLRASHTKATAAQLAAAKATDTLATKQAGMAAITRQYGGAMAAYSKTSAGGINNLRNSVEILATKFGQVLLPVVKILVGLLGALMKPLGGLLGVVKQMTPEILALTAAWMAYKVAMVISAAVSAVTGTALIANTVAATAQVGVMGGLTAAWVELNAIMDANPIMIVVLAIAALVAAFVLAYNHIKWFRDMVDAVWAWMKTAASDVTNWIITAWGNVVKFVTKLPGVLANAGKGMWDWLKQGFQDVIAWVMGAWNFLLSKMNVDVGPIHIHPGASLRFSQAAITNERYGRSSVRAVGGGRGTPPILVGQKAAGGLTSTTGPYLVGERGPEVVSLPQGAYVTPNNQLGAGGAQTIVIYNVLDGRKISQSVIRQGLLQQSRGG